MPGSHASEPHRSEGLQEDSLSWQMCLGKCTQKLLPTNASNIGSILACAIICAMFFLSLTTFFHQMNILLAQKGPGE